MGVSEIALLADILGYVVKLDPAGVVEFDQLEVAFFLIAPLDRLIAHRLQAYCLTDIIGREADMLVCG